MRRQRPKLFHLVGLVLALLSITACQNSPSSLVEKADREALNQRGALASHLYIQVIGSHQTRDEVRLKALEGLADVSLSQLFDHQQAMKAMNTIISEYGGYAAYADAVRKWRLRAADVARVQLQKPERAVELLEPLKDQQDSNAEVSFGLGEAYLASGNYADAATSLKFSFSQGLKSKNCALVKSAQLNLVQAYSLQKDCENSISWAKEALFDGCESDSTSLQLEMANCYEVLGDAPKAIEIYQNMISKNSQNTRAHFLLESLKRRQREKLIR